MLLKTITYRPKEISLRLDNENLQGPILMVAFGNIKSYGKGMQITPLAEPDDGLLDVCWIDPVKTFRLYRFFPTVFAGEHINMPEVHYYRSSIARVESLVPLDLYGDGEFLGQTPFTLRVLPQALRVLGPMNSFRPTYTVSQLTLEIKTLLEHNFEYLWLEGEISNLRLPSSGHLYFTLKDEFCPDSGGDV